MQKLTLVVAALFLASTTATHAELVQSLPLSSYTDNNSLANQLLERDSATAPLFQSTKTNKPAAPVRSAKTDTPTTVSVNVLDTPDVSKVDVADDQAEPDLIDRMSTLASQTVLKKLNYKDKNTNTNK